MNGELVTKQVKQRTESCRRYRIASRILLTVLSFSLSSSSSYHLQSVTATPTTAPMSRSVIAASLKSALRASSVTGRTLCPRRSPFSTNQPYSAFMPSLFRSHRLFPSASRPARGLVTVPKMSAPAEMSDEEKYIFDLNGYIIIRGVFTPEEVAEANSSIDRHLDQMKERTDPALRNTKAGSPLRGDETKGRKDLGGILEWGEDSKIFKRVLAHERLVPYQTALLGKGFRMDHMPYVIAQEEGSEGFHLHGGTVDCESGVYAPYLAYSCVAGQMHTQLLGCSVVLTDHNPGDGGFCVVRGSHKSNFRAPADMVHGSSHSEFVTQPVTAAGDVILFCEGTVHGALPWKGKAQRRLALFRFAPAFLAYGRSYMDERGGRWPDGMYEGLSDAQAAILEAPYANRLDRPNIEEDGSVVVTSRNEKKKQWDRTVFGTKYF